MLQMHNKCEALYPDNLIMSQHSDDDDGFAGDLFGVNSTIYKRFLT